MVSRLVTESAPAFPATTSPRAASAEPAQSRRIGPAGTLAADNAFSVALVTLWHRASEAGGAIGFVPPVARPEVAARVAPVVDGLRSGQRHALALIEGRSLIGFGQLIPGGGLQAHTGHLATVIIDPDRQRQGLGERLVRELLTLAAELGLERIDVSARGGTGLDRFYARLGFVEWGRRPGWIRLAPGVEVDDIYLQRPV